MRDVEFESFVVVGKAQIAQIDPNLALGKPIEFGWKLSFEESIIMLTAPSGIAQEKNLAPQTGNYGVFD